MTLQNDVKHREPDHQEIARLTEEFLAKGGVIEIVTGKPRQVMGGYNSRYQTVFPQGEGQ